MKTLRIALVLGLAALPSASALACGGPGMSESEMTEYTAQNRVLMGVRPTRRAVRAQAQNRRHRTETTKKAGTAE